MTETTTLIADDESGEDGARLDAIAGRIQTLIDKRVAERSTLEQRWLEDTRQLRGEYDATVQIGEGRSRAFYPLTAVLTDMALARWSEMVLPTDARNWSIQPTPVAEMMRSVFGAPQIGQAMAGIDPQQVQELAKQKARRMQDIIDDQLTEGDYNKTIRAALKECVELGTGIVKSPVVVARTKYRRERQDMGYGVTEYAKVAVTEYAPAVEHVSCWDFFPDLAAPDVSSCDSVVQRHSLTRKRLLALADLPGFDAAAVRLVASRKPGWRVEGYKDQAIAQDEQQRAALYQVWEFTGALEDGEGVALCGCESEQYIVWMCDGVVLKAAPHDGDLPYHAVCWHDDPHSLFGTGVPRRVRNEQRVVNSLYRMILDHAPLAALGVWVTDFDAVEPLDGKPTISPGKVFRAKRRLGAGDAPVQVIQINTRIDQLEAQLQAAIARMTEVAEMPLLAQTGNEPQVTQTATGTAMLMNSASTPLRRRVRDFDDHITRPVIRGMYDWNMEYSDDEDAKGDFDIVALGSVSLLVREQQTQGLVQLAQLAGSNPQFAQATKWLDMYRQIIGSLGINADGLIKTDDELANEQQGEPQPTPEQIEMQYRQQELQLKQAELQLKEQALQIDTLKAQVSAQDSINDLRRAEIAASSDAADRQMKAQIESAKLGLQIKLADDQHTADLGKLKVKEDAANQRLIAEIGVKQRMGSGV